LPDRLPSYLFPLCPPSTFFGLHPGDPIPALLFRINLAFLRHGSTAPIRSSGFHPGGGSFCGIAEFSFSLTRGVFPHSLSWLDAFYALPPSAFPIPFSDFFQPSYHRVRGSFSFPLDFKLRFRDRYLRQPNEIPPPFPPPTIHGRECSRSATGDSDALPFSAARPFERTFFLSCSTQGIFPHFFFSLVVSLSPTGSTRQLFFRASFFEGRVRHARLRTTPI